MPWPGLRNGSRGPGTAVGPSNPTCRVARAQNVLRRVAQLISRHLARHQALTAQGSAPSQGRPCSGRNSPSRMPTTNMMASSAHSCLQGTCRAKPCPASSCAALSSAACAGLRTALTPRHSTAQRAHCLPPLHKQAQAKPYGGIMHTNFRFLPSAKACPHSPQPAGREGWRWPSRRWGARPAPRADTDR